MTRLFIATTPEERLQIGACWPGTLGDPPGEEHDGWYIRLPGGRVFHTMMRSWNGKQYGARWTVTGEAPDFTISPSINMEPGWHGSITNGEMRP